MIYVEWLRVRGALKWTAIALAAILLVFAIVRIAVGTHGSPLVHVDALEKDPHARVTHTVLPDGAKRTAILNTADGTRVTIDDRGYEGKMITVNAARGSRSMHDASDGITIGSVQAQSGRTGDRQVTTILTNHPVDAAIFAVVAAAVALIVGTLLGAPFARENDGHLEIAWTKPIGREALAIQTMAIDLAGLVAIWVMAIVAGIVGFSIFQAPHLLFGWGSLVTTILALLGSLAWYAMLTAATAWMRRSYAAVLAVAWPVAGAIALLASLDPSTGPIQAILHAVFSAVLWIVPIAYLHFGTAVASSDAARSAATDLSALAVLTVAYMALAVVLWRRMEA